MAHTSSVQGRIEEKQHEVARLSALLGIYPDLTEESNRWRRVFLSSRAVNAIATQYEIDISCGCCPDPELHVRVFVETPHGRVYGFPLQLSIGERDDNVDYPAHDWDLYLKAHGIQDSIIDRLRAHFEDQQEDAYDETVCHRAG